MKFDQKLLETLASQLAELCPPPPGADVTGWLREQLTIIQWMNLPAEVATQMIDNSYMEWIQEFLDAEA